eukprot:TRINITY_DN12425_c0_g1_i1.p1 TRINITY_DN12425_c0_g1~~TRINITY_DN12425_c0_g1_i1.p1  ORF type:complete len:212 (-),score=30.00 TRINITY_DN12425_c0_g1_i1:20-655(-)
MSKYLSSSYNPAVFADSVVDIVHAVEHLTDVERSIPVPRVGDKYVYNRVLYSKLLSTIILLEGNTINTRPAVIAETDITKALLGSIIEDNNLQWGLVYSKEQRKVSGKDSKEVSLSNAKRFIANIIIDSPNLEIDSLGEYLTFVEAESEFLDAIQDALTPEITKAPKKGSSTIMSTPVNKSELERFKGIAEKMRLLQESKTKENVNPDDLW